METKEPIEYNAKELIAGFRKARGFERAEDIAKQLNITKPTYLKYESKPWTMSLGMLDELENLLGEDFRDMFFKYKLYKKKK